MKKIYFLLTLVLAMVCTVGVDAQKYSLLEEARGPKAGETYAIMNAELNTFISCKYGGNGGLLTTLPDEDVLWKLEATGEQTPAGYDLYYLYSVGQQKYVQEVDLEGNPGLDGYDVFGYSGFNFELGSKTHAAKVTVEKGIPGEDQVENEVWRTNGPSTGYVIARQNAIARDGQSPWLMKFGVQNVNVAFEPYNESVAWQFWVVARNTPKQELEAYVDLFSGNEYIAGTDPGYYPAETVEAYEVAYAEAMMASQTDHTDAEYQAYLDALIAAKEAVENSYVEITDGYYYVVSSLTTFMEKQSLEMACYMDPSSDEIGWKPINEKDGDFLFYISKLPGGNYSVKSYSADRYWSCANTRSNSQRIKSTATHTIDQVFTPVGGGQWNIWNTDYSNMYHCESNSDGKGKSGRLVTWSVSGKGNASTWYVRALTNLGLIDSLEAVKTQAAYTAELKSVCSDAGAAYDKLFVYSRDESQPLITNVNDLDPDDCQISSNASDPSEGGSFAVLIDKDPDTFWHSTYHESNDPGTYHYLQADISNNPQKSFQIFAIRRAGTYGNYDRPTDVKIYVTNDTTGQWNNTAKWTLACTASQLASDNTNGFYTPGVTVDTPAKYIRFEVTGKNDGGRNLNGWPYFNLAEFQIYPVVLDEVASQYYYIDGMKAAADALKARELLHVNRNK